MNRPGTLNNCPVCGTAQPEPFFSLKQVPVFCNVLWDSREKAVNAPRGDIDLVFCRNCGFIWNTAFDANLLKYSVEYENSLHFSPRFQHYAEKVARHLVNDYGVNSKHVIDIGCGKGDFILLLSKMGSNKGVGFDTSYEHRAEHAEPGQQVTFVNDYYSSKYADLPTDLISCRHVLEHIPQPTAFLNELRQIIGERHDSVVFFEVPNGRHTFENLAVWDIIYEHPNYFAINSLMELFEHTGFKIVEVNTEFEDQYLTLIAYPSKMPAAVTVKKALVDAFYGQLAGFKSNFEMTVARWREMLSSLERGHQRAVVWGAGSKGVTFLNVLRAGGVITGAVDINPRKHGKFIAGSGQKIIAVDKLYEVKPDVVIIMNPVYEDEIKKSVAGLDLVPEFVVV